MAKKTYEPAPEVRPELQERYATVLAVMAGEITVSEGARRLGLSRNHFQTLMHRGLKGLLEGLEPGRPGRPGKPAREAELEQQLGRLEEENRKLRQRTETVDRLLEVASGMIRGRTRAPRARTNRPTGTADEGADPELPELTVRVDAVSEMREAGLPERIAAAIVGASVATLRRWRGRVTQARPRQRTEHTLPEILRAPVEKLVRDLHGLIGAEALRHAVPGISRRQAAAVKRDTLIEIERERVARAKRVEVTVPGVVRGFDAMHVATTAGVRYPLIAGDAAVPFRTSVLLAERYDSRAVREALERDFALRGAPLVLRLDRWKAHDAPEVADLLRRAGVLALHGPPHHPRYYGQLERQNREHRAWLSASPELSPPELEQACQEMLETLNGAWPRATLTWRTSWQAWRSRPGIDEDRDALRDEVQDRAARIRRQAGGCGATAAMAERFAIEAALINRGYLRLDPGGWC